MAWGISDLAALLNGWAVWKDLKAKSDKVPELEARIAALEGQLDHAPGSACPKCGALEFRTEKTIPASGALGMAGATQ